jgi:hypothetical protein
MAGEPLHTTLYSHICRLLLGSGTSISSSGSDDGQSALAAFGATGGRGPDDLAFWEHLFLLRVEHDTLQRLLRALPSPLGPREQKLLSLIFARSVDMMVEVAKSPQQQPCSAAQSTRVANACRTLEILLAHLLAERRLSYVDTEASICGQQRLDEVVPLFLSRILGVVNVADPKLQRRALRTILAVAKADRLSASPLFALLLEARCGSHCAATFTTTMLPTKQSDAAGNSSSSSGGGGGGGGIGGGGGGAQLFSALLGVLAAANPTQPAEKEPEAVADWDALQTDAAALLVLAVNHQRGESQNSCVAGIVALGPRDSQRLQSIARVVTGGLSSWLFTAIKGATESGTTVGWASFLVSKWWAGSSSSTSGLSGDAATEPAVHADGSVQSLMVGLSDYIAAVSDNSWVRMISCLLLLYELVFRSPSFIRALYEHDRILAR